MQNRSRSTVVFLCLAICAIALSSCQGPKKPQSFIAYATQSDIPYKEGRETPSVFISVSLLDFGQGAEAKALNNILYEGLEVKDYAAKVTESYKTEYMSSLGEILKSTELPTDIDEVSNWGYSEELSQLESPAELYLFQRFNYGFVGGPHPDYHNQYFSYDRRANRRLILSDIVKQGGYSKLLDMAAARLKTRFEVQPGEGLSSVGFFEDGLSIPANENFSLSREGLILLWPCYELAPYVLGDVDVCLPYDEIKGFLTGRGKALAKSWR